MKCTFTLPSGNQIETATQRDLVLLREDSKGPWIEKRSDSLDTLRALAAKMRRAGSGGPVRQYIGDTRTGQLTDVPS